jgi:hypothetical protein
LDGVQTRVAEIVRRLGQVKAVSITVAVVSAVLLALCILGLAWLLVSVLDMGLGVPGTVMRIVAVGLLVLALGALAYGMWRIFRVSHSIRSYAARVGKELDRVGLDLLTALDLSGLDNRRLGYSPSLVSAAVERIAARVRDLNLQASVRKRRLVRYALPAVAIVAVGLVWFSNDPGSFRYSLDRLGYFLGLADRSGLEIEVRPGDREILAGEDLEISVAIHGYGPREPRLHVVSAGEETSYEMESAGGGRGRREYLGRLARVDRDLTYFVALGDESTRLFRISVYEEPRITGGLVELDYPEHTRLGREIMPRGVWDFSAPYGTRLRMALASNCSPDSAWVEIRAEEETTRLALAPVRDSLMAEITLRRDFDYVMDLAASGRAEPRPHGPHLVGVIPDEAPYVRIESPGIDLLLEADMTVPLSVMALDDYGISSMHLHYASPAETSSVALPFRGRAQARGDYMWEIGDLDVFPGDAVAYYVEVADNDALTGPKYARTETFIARVPTMYDLYRDIEDDQAENIEDLAEVVDEAEELKSELEDLIEDVKRTNQMDWEQQQTLRKNLEKQDRMQEKVSDVERSVDETLERMAESDLVDFEVIDKMEQVRKLLSEVATEEMMRSMERLREEMDNLSPEEVKRAMENLDLSREELLQRLDRTLEMLKKLQIQQRMEAAVKLAEEVVGEQKSVNQELGEGVDPRHLEIRQRSLMADAERLKEMAEELAEMLEQERSPVSSEVEEAARHMEAEGTMEKMSAAMSSMAAGQAGEAGEKGESAERDLSEVARMLREARDKMTGKEKQEIMEAMTRAMNDLRDVSRRQEEVMDDLGRPSGEVSESELARREVVFKEALDRVAADLLEVSRKSVMVSPMLGRAVLEIAGRVEEAADLLHEGMRAKARPDVVATMAAINELVTALMDTQQQASCCSSPTGMCEAFQKLDSMCQMQMGINQGTQNMMQSDQGTSMEARARMSRLAAEQEAVRKGLEELAREVGDRGEILGRLDDLAEEAARAVEELQGQDVDPETVRRQERILTRLLNARTSMRRRDYSERRKSRTAEEYEAMEPPEVSVEDTEQEIRDLLYRRRGYYPPEYEDLIRAYFQALSEGRRRP